jgi:hypothetical protein
MQRRRLALIVVVWASLPVGFGGWASAATDPGVPGSSAANAGRLEANDAGNASAYNPLVPARIMDTRPGMPTSDGAYSGPNALGTGEARALPVLGRGGVPTTGVSAVAINLTATEPTADGVLTIWPSGEARPGASNLNFHAGQTIANAAIVKVGSGGSITIGNMSGSTHVVVDVVGWFAGASEYRPIVPARVLETRYGEPIRTLDWAFQGVGPVGPGGVLELAISGRPGMPDANGGSVVLNVTVTQPTASSVLSVWPTGSPRPTASNLNFTPDQTTANLVIAKLGAQGKVSLWNMHGSSHVVVDVLGWFPTAEVAAGVQPSRLMDTRADHPTADALQAGEGPLGPGATRDVLVLGRGGVPSSGVGAVVLNVTATEPTASGVITAWPSGSGRPTASNLNFAVGQTVPNLVIAKVGVGGKVSLWNMHGSTHLVVDVMGWITSASMAAPSPPTLTHAIPTLGAMSVGWTPPVNNGGAPINAIVVTAQPSGETCTWVVGDTGPCVVSGLPPGVAQTLTATATNAAGITSASSAPLTATPIAFTALSAHTSAGCGRTTDGRAACWNQGFGAVQSGDLIGVVPELDGVEQVVAGLGHACALITGGTVKCWGASDTGAHGAGNTFMVWTPTEVPGLADVTRLAAGESTTCAVFSDGTVKCWGRNSFGEATGGIFHPDPVLVPTTVAGVENAVDVALSWVSACALLATGQATCWGWVPEEPGPFEGLDGITQLVVAGAHGCALRHGEVWCWGQAVENGTATGSGAVATKVAGLEGVTRIASSGAATLTCAEDAEGVKCWGRNAYDPLGLGSTDDSATPVLVWPGHPVDFSVGPATVCIAPTRVSIRCQGSFTYAQDGS